MLGLKSIDLKKVKTETLAIPVCEDKNIHDDKIISSLITRAKKLEEFKGDSGEEVIFYSLPEIKANRIILMGLGKLEKLNAESLRAFAGKAVKKCINMKLPEVLIVLPSAKK
ncbi:MAG: hypothetical protein KJ976_05750, partial [Proteobacteria bacterium]|nr:hypothetical protein [Pseudomonadota bacterium]